MEIHDNTTAVEGIKGRVDLPTLEHGLNLDCSRKTWWSLKVGYKQNRIKEQNSS